MTLLAFPGGGGGSNVRHSCVTELFEYFRIGCGLFIVCIILRFPVAPKKQFNSKSFGCENE